MEIKPVPCFLRAPRKLRSPARAAIRRFTCAVALGVLAVLALGAAGPLPAQAPPGVPRSNPMANLVVRVRMATGADVRVRVEIHLAAQGGFIRRTEYVLGNGEAVFHALPLDSYNVEVRAEGFQTLTETIFLADPNVTVPLILFLHPEGTGGVRPLAKPPILLAPRAQREVDRSLAALRENTLGAARRHILQALRMAPGHPQVNYLAGLIFTRLGEMATAVEYLAKAATLDPGSADIHLALGSALYQMKEYARAVTALERALVLEPNNFRAHWTLANALLQLREFPKAAAHAEKARELNAAQAPEAGLVIAMAQAELGQREEAAAELRRFLAAHPSHPRAGAARNLLASLTAARETRGGPAVLPAVQPALDAAPAPAAPAAPPPRWSPPVVEDKGPAVHEGIACDLPEVLRPAGRNILQLAGNLDRVAALESLAHEDLAADGGVRSQLTRQYDYVAAIRETRPGLLSVEEYRQRRGARSGETEASLQGLYTGGLAALAFIFHPYYSGDFEMRCEGLGTWRGQPAWQIHFRQKAEVESRVRVYHTDRGRFPVALKGRAWFGVNSYQILRIEAGLAAPVAAIQLEAEHMAIDYVPVDFPQRRTQLWLPAAATLHTEFRGRRIRRVHQFSDFVLFSVESKDRVRGPDPP